MLYRHTIEYYSTVKRNEILTRAVTWLNLENMCSGRHERARAMSSTPYETPRIVKCIA